MILDKYIRELLFLEDCVIIPGLGGFVSKYSPAKIREEAQTFIPPTKEIGFNTELTDDDGLLVSYMSQYMDRPESVIRDMITIEVSEIRDSIRQKEKVNIEGVGYFSAGNGGALVFNSNLEINFLTDSFGLSSFIFPVLEKERQSFFSRSIIFRQPDQAKRDVLPGSVHKASGKDRTAQQIVIALSILVLMSILPLNSRISESIFHHPASLGPLPSLVNIDPPVELLDMPSDIVIYPIIAGSFQSTQNAEKLCQKLVSKGYIAKVDNTAESFCRVIITEFSSISEAELALPDLQADNRDLQLWVLK